MDIKEIAELRGEFVWSYGQHFFIETKLGNFEWSDPDYGGDHTLVPFEGGYTAWIKYRGIPYGRSKGSHEIGAYCQDREGKLPELLSTPPEKEK